ncbi:MAG: PHP domain-containing protein [Desulfurococcales archaeon]|nr:PHP domain-containing protein [Desulfurococcales archaeon]MEB3758853.1 PHP domain-containing protein [Desulfurococcales archaeon]MEB3787087.1 PHP domain-containing protein [Desulfurococcales archaeon]
MDEGLKAETHCHTTSSDGRHPPDQVVLEANKKGLDFLAVTDHNTFRGAVLAQRAVKLRGLEKPVVIPGNEVRTTKGDVLVLCEKPLSKIKKDPWDLRDLADENNCVMIAAHPYSIIEPAVGDFIREAPELFDAIEVWNATNLPFLNSKAARVARELGKPGTAGSDAHVKEEIGSAYTLVYTDEGSVESFLEAVRKGDIRPVKGLPSLTAVLAHLAWGVKRRI